MEQNNWVRGSIAITEYRLDSKGIHLIRNTMPNERPKNESEPGADDPKSRKSDDKRDKPE
ncbi:MAG: hypothetical protein OXI77_06430 [Chloroflexota bacterium]|nr:hypothetical protein [Chloroflexota bacterium]MDE2907920.1 hypothetical protein [Chloroflexota bacterium]